MKMTKTGENDNNNAVMIRGTKTKVQWSRSG